MRSIKLVLLMVMLAMPFSAQALMVDIPGLDAWDARILAIEKGVKAAQNSIDAAFTRITPLEASSVAIASRVTMLEAKVAALTPAPTPVPPPVPVPVPPPTPTPAPVVTGSATLTWNATPDAKGYKVYQGTASKTYTKTTDVGNVTTFLVSGLTVGTTYYFAVTAYNDAGESLKSDEVNKLMTAAPPTPMPPTPMALAVPANLKPTDNAVLPSGSTTATVSWDAVPGATGYMLRVTFAGADHSNNFVYYKDGLAATSATFPVVPGKSYDWWVHGATTTSTADTAKIGPAAVSHFSVAP